MADRKLEILRIPVRAGRRIFVAICARLLMGARYVVYSRFANDVRVHAYRSLGARIGKNVQIRPNVLIKGCKSISIGDGVFIGEFTSIVAYGGQIDIGEDCLIADFVYISSRNHRFRTGTKRIKAQGYKSGDIKIGEDVWLAHGVTVLAGSEIAKGTVIGANLVAPKSTIEYAIHSLSGTSRREQ